MKRINLILIILTFTASISFSQNLENVGAGVIDFLLRNPKTANKMNTTETVALDIIGDLLKTESQRKHQLQYASAGRNQVTINSNDGRQAQFVKSESGKVFLLIDGVIYPIATELVNQAKGIESTPYKSTSFTSINTNFDYEAELANYFKSDLNKTVRYKEPYTVGSGGEYFYDIVNKTGIPKDYIGDENYNRLSKKYFENSVKIPANKKLTIAREYPQTVILPAFGFKWVRDLNGNNTYDIEEFKQKKKVFYNNENFYISIPFVAGKYSEGKLFVELFNNYTGQIIKSDTKYIGKDKMDYYLFYFNANELNVGAFGINCRLENLTTNDKTIYNTTFEVVMGNSATKELTIAEKKIIEQEKAYKNKITVSTPKNVFFCTSWKDKNNNGRYEYDEFNGLNKSSYSLSKDSLYVSINFPEKTGEFIIQSWTKEGKLLGTTTKQYQRIMTNWINPDSNPYTSMDFIDMVKINGVGEYKITVNFVEGGKYEQKLIITE